jgi:3,4-dihydroxy-9,10-secoandrosta-1,3,5(10)-triene-9,17-dione 4,5-dioxygenase
MSISSLGYVRVEAADPERWRAFGCESIGLMASDGPNDALYLRSDERPFRFLIEKGSQDRYLAAGLEVRDEKTFEATLERLARADVEVTRGSDSDARTRCVNAFASCADPSGNVLELYYGRVLDPAAFASPAGVSGFIGGDLGMGHVVLPAVKLEETRAFYKKHLGFGDTDEIRVPLSPDPNGPELKIYFMHCENRRHHSVALIPMPAPSGLVHTMLEARTVDDVGRTHDRCVAAGHHISSSLGRHSNDFMFSFYVQTPAGFDLEFGCDGLMPDWNTWAPTRNLGPSLWGHKWAAPPQV